MLDNATRDLLVQQELTELKLSFEYSAALHKFFEGLGYERRRGTMPYHDGRHTHIVVLPFKQRYWLSAWAEGITVDIAVEEITKHRVIIKHKD